MNKSYDFSMSKLHGEFLNYEVRFKLVFRPIIIIDVLIFHLCCIQDLPPCPFKHLFWEGKKHHITVPGKVKVKLRRREDKKRIRLKKTDDINGGQK